MQQCGSTNKLSTKLNAAENKFDTGDLFMNGENHRGKTLPVNLRSPFSRIHYYQKKRLQVKGIPVPNTNLYLKPYPNIQLDLYYSDNLIIQCMNPNT